MAATHLSIRIDLAAGARIGPGKIALLEAIRATGSISAAARSLGMSYRRAWLLVEDVNRALLAPAVTTETGGRSGGGNETATIEGRHCSRLGFLFYLWQQVRHSRSSNPRQTHVGSTQQMNENARSHP